ncbi:hypothetical protein E3P99_02990 [Wallemia hederae]|uniref:RRM domain-containing protein n=1 Tax=Wallemia hederae TaxID=1540922 RepID=A0A4T0FHR2_9BASI|nr:hypothetical protein E3P99_02990 [Wallemia hederae]
MRGVKNINGKRLLCLADVRGDFESLNRLAAEYSADVIIHTGDLGFLADIADAEKSSIERASEKVLRHLITYSPVISPAQRQSLLNDHANVGSLRAALSADENILSTFPRLVDSTLQLSIPVYAVSGACEDVAVLEKLRMKEYKIPNLHVLDEASSYLLHIGGVKLRVFGIGGAFVLHKLFDNGDGQATIAGGQGTTWITALQIGELIDTAKKVYDPSETRLLVSHSPPGREGLLAQLALVLKADLTLSASLHFRMSSSYNDFSVVPSYEVFMQKLVNGRTAVYSIYNSVKSQLDDVLDDSQRILLANFLLVADRVPGPNNAKSVVASHEEAWKHTWHFNLSDVSVGNVVLNVADGKIGSEVTSEGFTYSHRRNNDKTAALAGNEVANDGDRGVEVGVPAGAGVGVGLSNEEAAQQQQSQQQQQQQHQQPPPPPPQHTPLNHSEPANQIPTADSHTKNTTPQIASPPPNTTNNNNTNSQRKKGQNTLFIRGLPPNSTEEEVRDLFTPYSQNISSIKILIDHKTGNQRGLCYVDFNTEGDMLAAEKLNGRSIRDTPLQIMVSDKSNKPKNTHKGKRQQDGSL